MSAIVKSKGVMPSLLREQSALLLCGFGLALANGLCAQSVGTQGQEYSLSGAALGDQFYPQAILTPTGGYVVWQDNVIDGIGQGIAARRLDSSGAAASAAFCVNSLKKGYQERPEITLLKNGGAGIVWQGGSQGAQNIYLKLLTAPGTFVNSNDLQINTYTNGHQRTPVITSCTSGAVAISWSSTRQDGDKQGIYARLVRSLTGEFITKPFRVNEFTQNNQRNPAIAGLSNGNFVVVWVSENQGVSDPFATRADLYGRIFTIGGTAVGHEFRINTTTNLCGTPSVAGTPDGFTVVWSHRDEVLTNSWDVRGRNFTLAGAPSGPPFSINTTTYGDQFAPKISSLGAQQLVVWTAWGQDGSWDGIVGRLLTRGNPNGGEFRINSRTISRQREPMVASDRNGRFLAVWSSYIGASGFDIRAQRFAAGQPPLPAPDPPLVTALGPASLGVTWPEPSGISVQSYELYADGSADPISVPANRYLAQGLEAGSTHSYELAFVRSDGLRSEKSAPATGQTWGADVNGDGLPDDWQTRYFGTKVALWGGASVDSDGDGASNAQELLAGTDPNDRNSVLRARIENSPQGKRLHWGTQRGAVYQVQHSGDFTNWQSFGSARFAAGTADSVLLSGSSNVTFYRVIRLQ